MTELDWVNMIFERLAYMPPAHQEERSAPQRTQEAPGEPQQEQSRAQGREEQNQPQRPQRPQNGPVREEQAPPPERQEVPPPKKDSRSGRDSPAINTSSATPSDSERMRRMVEGPIDRPSVEERLKGFRAQLEQKRKLAPTRTKTRAQAKQR